MTILRRILTATALAAMASSVAMANSIDFTHTTTSQTSPFTDSFSLSNFNTSLGTLTAVTITLSYTTTGEVDVDNPSGSNKNFTNATSSVPLTLDGPEGLTTNVNAVAGPVNGTAIAGSVTPFKGLTGSGILTIDVPVADFGDFENPPSGSFDTGYSVAAANGSFAGTGSSLFFGGSAESGGVTEVLYNYTIPSSTPEPATMALMGGALIGLGLFGKKRFKKS